MEKEREVVRDEGLGDGCGHHRSPSLSPLPYLQVAGPGRPIDRPQADRPVLHCGRPLQGRVRGGQDLALQLVDADRRFQQVPVKGGGEGGGDVQGGIVGRGPGPDLGQQVGEAGGDGGDGRDVRELEWRRREGEER